MKRAAPAKINLSLRILGKRSDGFHEIETLMCPVSLCDELELELSPQEGLVFECNDPGLPRDDSNLVVRAARLFFARLGAKPGVRISLVKNIPHGAGLGGGSSDAAATLMALNDLLDAALPLSSLSELAAQLGSDVPFFLHQSPAICRGRGELIEPVALTGPLPLLLVKPPFEVPTPWAYGKYAGSRELPGIDYAPQHFAWGTLENDLERPVFEKYLFLALLKRWLRAQPEVAGALMSGSGATLFALLRRPEDAAALQTRARRQFGGTLRTAPCHGRP